MLQPISISLQNGIRFLQILLPASPSVCLAVSHSLCRRRYRLTTFHFSYNMDNLDSSRTPMELKFTYGDVRAP